MRSVFIKAHIHLPDSQALYKVRPQCKFHVYDGTNFGRGEIKNAPPFVTFFPENFNKTTHERYIGQKISVFKMDCEGCEYDSLIPTLQYADVEQVLVEVHGCGLPSSNTTIAFLHRFMMGLTRKHGIFYREPNIIGSDGTCIEFALRKREDSYEPRSRVERSADHSVGSPSTEYPNNMPNNPMKRNDLGENTDDRPSKKMSFKRKKKYEKQRRFRGDSEASQAH